MVDKSLEKAARDAGAVDADYDATKDVPGIRERIGTGKIDFHNELPKIKFVELLASKFVIRQIKIVEDWDSTFGTSEFALMMIGTSDGKKATTLAGGRAIVRQAKKLLVAHGLPVSVTLNQVQGQQGAYYIFE